MIYLELGITYSQVLPVTTQENVVCGTTCSTTVFYIKNQLTRREKYFIPIDDISPITDRLNMFEVQVVVGATSSENLDSGIIFFTQSDIGLWKYEVYQQPCDVIGIDPEEFIIQLETGYLKIK